MSVFDSYYETFYITDYYRLMNNITCVGTWQPIETTFKGTFDGNFKTISNISMSINSSNDNYGLFKSIQDATFNNLYISNFNVTSGNNSSNVVIGGISGYATSAYIEGCQVLSGSVAYNYNNYASYVGGLVGFSTFTQYVDCIVGSTSNPGLSLYGYGTIGGIAGHTMGGSFSNCINRAHLFYYWNGSNNMYTGGIVGRATSSTTINNCYNYGSINFAGEQSDSKNLAPYMGQIVGYKASSVSVTNCSYLGPCYYSNLRKVGGFLGIGRTDQARYASTKECGYSE